VRNTARPVTLVPVLGLLSPAAEDVGREKDMGAWKGGGPRCVGEERSERWDEMAGCNHLAAWWTGSYGCAGLVPLLPKAAEGHHNSDTRQVWLPRACRNHGEGPPACVPESQEMEAGKRLLSGCF